MLMDPRFRRRRDRARLEREGNLILEAEARYEEKKRELKEEDRARLEREERRAKEILKKMEMK